MTKFGKTKSKQQISKQQISDYQLVRRHLDKYNKLLSVGFSKEEAIKRIKKDASMTSLDKLVYRYEAYKNQPGVTSISLQGIRRTAKIDNWIKDMVDKGLLIDKKYSLYYPPNPKLKRYKIL